MSALARLSVAAPRQRDMALQRASRITSFRKASTGTSKDSADATDEKTEAVVSEKEAKAKKTIAQLDEELREKLEGRSGDGGAAGLELEGGKPVAMKRGTLRKLKKKKGISFLALVLSSRLHWSGKIPRTTTSTWTPGPNCYQAEILGLKPAPSVGKIITIHHASRHISIANRHTNATPVASPERLLQYSQHTLEEHEIERQFRMAPWGAHCINLGRVPGFHYVQEDS